MDCDQRFIDGLERMYRHDKGEFRASGHRERKAEEFVKLCAMVEPLGGVLDDIARMSKSDFFDSCPRVVQSEYGMLATFRAFRRDEGLILISPAPQYLWRDFKECACCGHQPGHLATECIIPGALSESIITGLNDRNVDYGKWNGFGASSMTIKILRTYTPAK